jgi:hypothetical protein
MLNPKQGHLKEHDLKKQSQSAPGRIGAKSFAKGDYGNKPACGAEKNKPKQSQFPTAALANTLCTAYRP